MPHFVGILIAILVLLPFLAVAHRRVEREKRRAQEAAREALERARQAREVSARQAEASRLEAEEANRRFEEGIRNTIAAMADEHAAKLSEKLGKALKRSEYGPAFVDQSWTRAVNKFYAEVVWPGCERSFAELPPERVTFIRKRFERMKRDKVVEKVITERVVAFIRANGAAADAPAGVASLAGAERPGLPPPSEQPIAERLDRE